MNTPGFLYLPLKTTSLDGQNFILFESFTFVTKAGVVIVVPVGVTSDGASTPRLLWRELPPFGVYWPAAFLHDYLYRYTQCSKAFADSILSEAMELLGVIEAERIAIYEGVHIGGWSSFEQDRAAQPALFNANPEFKRYSDALQAQLN